MLKETPGFAAAAWPQSAQDAQGTRSPWPACRLQMWEDWTITTPWWFDQWKMVAEWLLAGVCSDCQYKILILIEPLIYNKSPDGGANWRRSGISRPAGRPCHPFPASLRTLLSLVPGVSWGGLVSLGSGQIVTSALRSFWRRDAQPGWTTWFFWATTSGNDTANNMVSNMVNDMIDMVLIG